MIFHLIYNNKICLGQTNLIYWVKSGYIDEVYSSINIRMGKNYLMKALYFKDKINNNWHGTLVPAKMFVQWVESRGFTLYT